MPAESCAQLRKAYVEAQKGADWAKELIEKTSEEFKSACGKKQGNAKRRFAPTKRSD